ncbi:beta strand repeat-containing protein [Haemophilus paracuniculus]|uniref:beta strand repeat-containing protein n=1 Tax=Haemophilus paracuniculus TaxID=734 RepID=UPI001FEA0D7A|nr:YadA-like family protein [Haemophilus paracuniculus]
MATAGGNYSVAIGTGASAPMEDGIAIGHNATARRKHNIVIGANATVLGNNAESQPGNIVIGWEATDTGGNANTVLGSKANTHYENRTFSTSQQLALGSRASVYGDQSLAIGADTIAGGNSSIAIGGDDVDKAWDKMVAAIPELNTTLNPNTAIGRAGVRGYADAKGLNTDMTRHIAGGKYPNTAAAGDASVAIGAQAQTAGVGANALGVNALAVGYSSTAIGTLPRAYGNNTIALGTASQAGEAKGNKLSGDDAMAVGHFALATAANSTALGTRAHARGYESLTLGTNSNVTGNYSVALGPNIRTVPTINSVVLGNGSTAVVGTTGASHAVEYVANAEVRNSNGETITYGEWGFKGQPQTEGQYVSIGEVDNERQLKNVAAGHIDANSTDGINGSQLYAVMAKLETGFVVSNNTVNATNHITPNKIVNFNNGTATTATVANWNSTDGSVAGVNVTFNVNTTPLTVSDGSNASSPTATTNKASSGKVDTPVDQNAIATAGDVANAINNAGWWTNATNPDGTSNNTLINPGDIVNFAKGSNLKLTQTNTTTNGVDTVTYTYSVVDTPTFTNVTIGNASNPIVIGTDGNGNNTISNLTSRLPKTVTENGTGTVTNPDGSTGQGTTVFTTNVTRPVLKAGEENNAATLGDVLNAGWNLQENNTAKDFVKPYDTLNFLNTTTVSVNITSDGNLSNVTWNVNTTPLAVSDGSNASSPTATTNKAPSGKVDTPVDQNAIATAGDVANAINNAGWWTNATNPDGTSNNTLINPGDIVNFAKGSNLKLTQTNTTTNGVDTVTYTYSVVDTPTFTNVTIGNASNPIVIGTDGNGNNTISNLTSRLPKTVTENGTGTVTNPDGSTGQGTTVFTTNVTRPVLKAGEENNAATLGDVLNAGWNLQENNKAKDFVKPYDTINFLNSSTVSVNITSDGNLSNVTWNVISGDVNTNTNPNTAEDKDNKVPATGTVVVNGTGYVTAETLAKAVNASGWKVTSDTVNGGDRGNEGSEKDEKSTQLVQPGEEVKFLAGKNLKITQNGQNFTYATQENVSFNNVNTTTMTLGNASNPAQPAVSFKTEKASPTVTTDKDGKPVENAKAPTSAVNLSDSAGNPVQLKGVASSLNATTPATSTGESVLDLNNATDPTAVVTVADLQKYGWIVRTEKDNNSTVVNNGEVVTFIGKNGINVTSVANGTNGNWDVVISGEKTSYTSNNNATDATVSFNNGNGTTASVVNYPNGSTAVSFDVNQTTGDVNENGVSSVKDPNAFLNAGDVSKLVNNAGWNVFQNNVSTAKKDTVTAGNNVAFNNGTYTTVNVTSDGTNTTITYDAKIGNLTNNANGSVNEGDISPNSLATAAGVAKAINNSGWGTNVTNPDGTVSKEIVNPGDQVNYVNGQGTTAKTTVVKNPDGSQSFAVSYSVNSTTADVNDAGSVNAPADPNAYLNAGEVVKLVNGVSWTVDSKTDSTTANGATKNTYTPSAKVKAGDTVRINAGRNIEISGSGRNINIATSNDPTFNNVKANKVDADDIVAGNSLTVGKGAGATKITSSPEGLRIAKADGKPQRILNVAPGQADTDAVNVSQLKGAIGNVNNRINKLNKQRKAGHASSMAAGNLMQAYREGQSVVTAGVGQYQGQTGLAVGYSRISDSGKVGIKLSAGVNSQKEISGAASVGYFW